MKTSILTDTHTHKTHSILFAVCNIMRIESISMSCMYFTTIWDKESVNLTQKKNMLYSNHEQLLFLCHQWLNFQFWNGETYLRIQFENYLRAHICSLFFSLSTIIRIEKHGDTLMIRRYKNATGVREREEIKKWKTEPFRMTQIFGFK